MSFFSSPMNDIDQGRLALKYFHNESCRYSPTYKESLDSLILKVGGKRPDIFVEGLGSAINSIEMSDSHVEDAMENLAHIAQGRIPANNSVFFKALSDREVNLTAGDWLGAVPSIAGKTALDAAKGAQQIGDAVLDVGKSLLGIGPLLIVAAVVFIGWQRTKMLAGK